MIEYQIEIRQTKNRGLCFRAQNYPSRRHYILQIGRREARAIRPTGARNGIRAFVALVSAQLAAAVG